VHLFLLLESLFLFVFSQLCSLLPAKFKQLVNGNSPL
jgi:hypothetical protein